MSIQVGGGENIDAKFRETRWARIGEEPDWLAGKCFGFTLFTLLYFTLPRGENEPGHDRNSDRIFWKPFTKEKKFKEARISESISALFIGTNRTKNCTKNGE